MRHVTASPGSRYRFSKIVSVVRSDLSYMGIWKRPEIPALEDDIFIRIGTESIARLDALATKYYGTPHLWWVIALVNRVRDPWRDTYAGATLRITSPTWVSDNLAGL
jgi:hypothetical protein